MKPWKKDLLYLALPVLAVFTYFFFAVQLGIYQSVPVVNLLVALVGCGGLLWGLQQQMSARRLALAVAACGLTAFFTWFTLVDSRYATRELNVAVGDDLGPRLGQLVLPSSEGEQISLLTTGEIPRATLLVFYRGYW